MNKEAHWTTRVIFLGKNLELIGLTAMFGVH